MKFTNDAGPRERLASFLAGFRVYRVDVGGKVVDTADDGAARERGAQTVVADARDRHVISLDPRHGALLRLRPYRFSGEPGDAPSPTPGNYICGLPAASGERLDRWFVCGESVVALLATVRAERAEARAPHLARLSELARLAAAGADDKKGAEEAEACLTIASVVIHGDLAGVDERYCRELDDAIGAGVYGGLRRRWVDTHGTRWQRRRLRLRPWRFVPPVACVLPASALAWTGAGFRPLAFVAVLCVAVAAGSLSPALERRRAVGGFLPLVSLLLTGLGAYLAQTGRVTWTAVAASVIVGLVAAELPVLADLRGRGSLAGPTPPRRSDEDSATQLVLAAMAAFWTIWQLGSSLVAAIAFLSSLPVVVALAGTLMRSPLTRSLDRAIDLTRVLLALVAAGLLVAVLLG